ncbi:hypothetical protein ACVWYG_003209 [Pedobacter sp. UYEF25]
MLFTNLSNKNGTGANNIDFNEANSATFYAANANNRNVIFDYPLNYKSDMCSVYASDVVDDRLGSAAMGAYKQTQFSRKFDLVYQPIIDGFFIAVA